MKYKILIVDDDRSVSDLLSHLFEGKGFETIVARNGRDALKRAKASLPNIIILDVVLPDFDGWSILRTLKHDPATKEIPVLMCTIKKLMGDIEQSVTLGAAGYIIKPFDIDRVIEKVFATLRMKKQ